MSGWTLYGDHDHSEVSVDFGSGGSFYTVYEPGRALPVAFVIGACGDHDEARARMIVAAPDLLREASEICAILDLYRAETGEEPCFDHEAIGEEVARRHDSLTAAISKATEPGQ